MKTFQNHIRMLCLLALMILPGTAAWAQTTATDDAANSTENELHDFKWYGEIGFEHSDNVYRLSESQKTALAEKEEGDRVSHRYEDMAAISDDILIPAIGFKYKSDSPLGGKFKLASRIRYNFHMENPKKNFPEAKIALENSIGKNGVLSLEGNFLFDFFKKNYLSGVNDENENGNITREERMYASARYDESETLLSYEHELLNQKGAPLSELDIRPFIGYSRRTYNSPFRNREREVSIGGLGLVVELLSKIDLEVIYQYENVRCPNGTELILYDETIDDTDINSDGEIKANAALATPVDRSAERYTIEITPRLKLSKDILLFAGYQKRATDYTSDNPLDIDHYRQTADREKYNLGLQYDFSKSLSAEVQYSRTDDSDTEEGDDYTENCFSLSVKYDLF